LDEYKLDELLGKVNPNIDLALSSRVKEPFRLMVDEPPRGEEIHYRVG
jgi:hypothetical protein